MTFRESSQTRGSAFLDACIRGAVDLSLGDPLTAPPEALDPLERVEAAVADGYRGIVLIDHLEPVSPVAAFLRDNEAFRPAIPVTAGVVLNHEVGGLNIFAAEHCLMLEGRLVAMPTLSSQNYARKFRRALARGSNASQSATADCLTIVDDRFQLRPDVQDVLALVADHDAVLDAGYGHLSEVWVLIEEAKRHGIDRILVRDPDRYAGAAQDEIGALANSGAFIGFTLTGSGNETDRFALYERVARERLVLHLLPQATAYGRLSQALSFIDHIREGGASENDVRSMVAGAGTELLEG